MAIAASIHNPNKALSAAATKAANRDMECTFTASNYLLNRHPDFYVYIYNVSEEKHIVSRPPTFDEFKIPGIRTAGNMDANGNPKKFILATRLPSPLVSPKPSTDSSEIAFDALDTRRFAMDIINPENLGIDQDAALDPRHIYSKNNDLGKRGVFWSLNGPGASKDQYGNPTGKFEEPTEDEVNRAIARLEKGYSALLEEARGIEASKPAELTEHLTPGHHAAADWFNEQFSWHGKKVKQENCENCGERVKVGSAFHKTDEGGMCIRNWARAVKAGVRTREQAFEATELPEFAPRTPAPVAVPSVVSQSAKSSEKIPTEN